MGLVDTTTNVIRTQQVLGPRGLTGATGPAGADGPAGATGPAGGGYGAYAARPAPGTVGKIFIASDGIVPFVDDGTNWRPFIRGVPGGEVAPGNSIAAFTQVGYAAPDAVNVQGGCLFFQQNTTLGNTDALLGYEVSLPVVGATPRQSTIHVIPHWSGGGQRAQLGIWARDSVSGKIVFFSLMNGGYGSLNLQLDGYTDFVTEDVSFGFSWFPPTPNDIWLRLRVEVGGMLWASWSMDGVNFETLLIVTSDYTTYVPGGGDRIGFGFDPKTMAIGMTVDSFVTENL